MFDATWIVDTYKLDFPTMTHSNQVKIRPERVRYSLALLLLAVSISNPAKAQEFGRINDMIATGTAYYVFAQPGEATVQVIVLGSVAAPGIYELGISVDLGQLLALSGGPPLTETTGATVSTNATTVRLFRKGTGRRDLVYEAPLDLLLTEPDLYPSLQDGDVFTVETITRQTQRFSWRDGLTIFSSALTAAILIDRLSSGR